MNDQGPVASTQEEIEIKEEIKSRPPCSTCGESMDGEHHRAKSHKGCRVSAVPSAVVKVIPDLTKIEEFHEVRHNFWMGTTADSPFQNVDVAGRSFPMASGQMTDKDGSGQPIFSGPRGTEAMLSDEEVEKIRKSVARKVVSWTGTGKNRRAVKRDMDALGFRQLPTDEPLGKYLFMHRTDSLGFAAKGEKPEPMVS